MYDATEASMVPDDAVIDLGPGAGEQGGRIVTQGTPEQVAKAKGSRTGPYLAQTLSLRA